MSDTDKRWTRSQHVSNTSPKVSCFSQYLGSDILPRHFTNILPTLCGHFRTPLGTFRGYIAMIRTFKMYQSVHFREGHFVSMRSLFLSLYLYLYIYITCPLTCRVPHFLKICVSECRCHVVSCPCPCYGASEHDTYVLSERHSFLLM